MTSDSVSVFRDKNTPDPFVEDFEPLGDDGESKAAAKPNQVYMDAMGFGMGCSCLQVTFQACNINEARCLYDQLAPVCPIAVLELFEVIFKDKSIWRNIFNFILYVNCLLFGGLFFFLYEAFGGFYLVAKSLMSSAGLTKITVPKSSIFMSYIKS